MILYVVCAHGLWTEKLISWENELSNYEQKSIAVMFSTQLEELDRQSHACSSLLKILSFFDPESIPLNIITDGANDLPSSMGPMSNGLMSQNIDSVIALMRSPVQFQRAIQQLRNLSLIGYESMTNASAPKTSTSVLRIHDLVQFVIQESVRRENTHHEWFRVAAGLVCSAVQRVGHALGKQPWSYLYWSQCAILSPHMQSLTKWRDGHAMQNPVIDKANTNIAQYLGARGRYRDAEMLVLPALANLEKLLGPEHLDTLRISSPQMSLKPRVITTKQRLYLSGDWQSGRNCSDPII